MNPITPEKVDTAFKDLASRWGADIYRHEKTLLPLLRREMIKYRYAYFYRRGLQNRSLYLNRLNITLNSYSLAREYSYIPFVESGYNPLAYHNTSKAKGMWQFIPQTANAYGLAVTGIIDEREDPEKSTDAACRYIKDLISFFGDQSFLIVLAAYNAGQGRILSAISRVPKGIHPSFSYLHSHNLIPAQTRVYVVRIIALILLTEYESLWI
ncbi:MAG: lytic transglycosylase domain-containing protein [Spirochaetales bacterium]|nr:lytic transglycosylase domain-containing protein [Spirochaetales bacterium]